MAVPVAAGVIAPARSHARRRIIKGAWALIAVAALVVVGSTVYVISLPGVGDALSRVKHILALHHGSYERPPPPRKFGDAVVSVEDEHFYDNFVVNVADGAGRAALGVLQTDRDPGGSTIDQQLAKQLYGDGDGLGGTLKAIALGVKLSVSYPKPQILSMYLNAVYYGHGYWGEFAAARGYFHTTPDKLDWAEAALLAGLPQAPSTYDPLEHLAVAKQRQLHVIDRLVVNHYLTRAQANAAYREQLPLTTPRG
ncbi:MAG: transglycosylase domain-containing protein [Solirubrobacteraceae bacterium]